MTVTTVAIVFAQICRVFLKRTWGSEGNSGNNFENKNKGGGLTLPDFKTDREVTAGKTTGLLKHRMAVPVASEGPQMKSAVRGF